MKFTISLSVLQSEGAGELIIIAQSQSEDARTLGSLGHQPLSGLVLLSIR